MNLFDREDAWELLKQHVSQPHLLRHCVSVEICMRAYAEKFGEDSEYWGTLGLLHDIDFDKHPDDHPNHADEYLSAAGYEASFIKDVESHCRAYEGERTLVQKTLLAVDEMPGFVLASALVRPDKSLNTLEVKSVTKKMKDKAFAKAVNRETLKWGAEALELPIEEHIAFIIAALRDATKKPEYQEVPLL